MAINKDFFRADQFVITLQDDRINIYVRVLKSLLETKANPLELNGLE